jgi:hypothetical protein
MESYHRLAIEEDSYSNTQDSFPCHTLNNRHYMACLDIGGAGTFSGNTTTPAIDWEVAADAQWYKNVSRDYLNASTASGRNLFGVTCGGGGVTAHHGDGVINSFDIGVLIFVLFGDYPYNNINTYANQLTVEQRPETQSRCGNDEDRASWQANLHANSFCPSTGSARRMLQYAADEGEAQIHEDISLVGAVGPANGWAQGTHHMNHEFVRTRFGGHNAEGSWHGFEFAPTIVPVIVELILHGVWSTGSAVLSNAPPPETGQDVPLWPERYQVRWSRTEAQSQFAEPGTECNAVVTGATGTQTLIGDTLSVRQEGRGSNCPFWLHLWTPVYAPQSRPGRRLADRALAVQGGQWPGRALSESNAELLTVWAKRGSSAMTTMGPVILNPSNDLEFGLSFGLTPAPPAPPAAPPAPPAPPLRPPEPPLEEHLMYTDYFAKIEEKMQIEPLVGPWTSDGKEWEEQSLQHLLDLRMQDVANRTGADAAKLTGTVVVEPAGAPGNEDVVASESTVRRLSVIQAPLNHSQCNESQARLRIVIYFQTADPDERDRFVAVLSGLEFGDVPNATGTDHVAVVCAPMVVSEVARLTDTRPSLPPNPSNEGDGDYGVIVAMSVVLMFLVIAAIGAYLLKAQNCPRNGYKAHPTKEVFCSGTGSHERHANATTPLLAIGRSPQNNQIVRH